MIKNLLVIIIILISHPTVNATPSYSSPTPSDGLKYHLAFSINPSHNSGYINFAIIGIRNNKIVSTKFITIHEFIKVGMGKQSSLANTDGINLFDEHGVKECLYKYDSTQCMHKNEYSIHELWTLRYSRNPFCPPDCLPIDGMVIEGYSQHKGHPSWPQLQILQQYGVIYINDFFYGDNMFKLMADFQKSDWLDKYKNSLDP